MVARIAFESIVMVFGITIVGFFIGKLFKEAEKEDQGGNPYVIGNYNDTGLDDRNYSPDDRIWNLCSDIRADG